VEQTVQGPSVDATGAHGFPPTSPPGARNPAGIRCSSTGRRIGARPALSSAPLLFYNDRPQNTSKTRRRAAIRPTQPAFFLHLPLTGGTTTSGHRRFTGRARPHESHRRFRPSRLDGRPRPTSRCRRTRSGSLEHLRGRAREESLANSLTPPPGLLGRSVAGPAGGHHLFFKTTNKTQKKQTDKYENKNKTTHTMEDEEERKDERWCPSAGPAKPPFLTQPAGWAVNEVGREIFPRSQPAGGVSKEKPLRGSPQSSPFSDIGKWPSPFHPTSKVEPADGASVERPKP